MSDIFRYVRSEKFVLIISFKVGVTKTDHELDLMISCLSKLLPDIFYKLCIAKEMLLGEYCTSRRKSYMESMCSNIQYLKYATDQFLGLERYSPSTSQNAGLCSPVSYRAVL